MSVLFRSATWLEGTSTNGYGTWPIPHDLDQSITALIGDWCDLGDEQRIGESSTITARQCQTLLAYSERMASKAVRTRDSECIRLGLIALGVDGWRTDWRDNIMVLSLHARSSEIIGADPSTLFGEAGQCLAPNVQRSFELFLQRDPEDRSIEAMGFTESRDEDGFRYKRTW